MGISQGKNTNEWFACYSRRHPITRRSYGLRRKYKTKAAALKGEKQLIRDVDRKIALVMIPEWTDFVFKYEKHMIKEGLSLRTVEYIYLLLKGSYLRKMAREVSK